MPQRRDVAGLVLQRQAEGLQGRLRLSLAQQTAAQGFAPASELRLRRARFGRRREDLEEAAVDANGIRRRQRRRARDELDQQLGFDALQGRVEQRERPAGISDFGVEPSQASLPGRAERIRAAAIEAFLQRIGGIPGASGRLACVGAQLERVQILRVARKRPACGEERGGGVRQLTQLDPSRFDPRQRALLRVCMGMADALVDRGDRACSALAEHRAEPCRHLGVRRIRFENGSEPVHGVFAVAHVHREQRRVDHGADVVRQSGLGGEQARHFLFVATHLREVPCSLQREQALRIARERLPVGCGGLLHPALLDEDSGLLQGEGRARLAVAEGGAEGQVVGEDGSLAAAAQYLLHHVQCQPILRIEGQRPAVLRDPLVAFAGGQPILRGFGAQQRRHARILAARGEPPAQFRALLASVRALVGADQRQELRGRLEVSRRLGQKGAQERHGLLGLAGAVRVERGRPTARLVALGERLRCGGEVLVCLRGFRRAIRPG